MLLIFGFSVRFRTIEHRPFFCPGCGGDRTGLVQAARRWFTLFFIPLIPLKELGHQVRCETCQRTWSPEVLDRPTTAALGSLLGDATRAVTAMVVAAGSVGGDGPHPATVARAVSLVGAVVPGYDAATLSSDAAHLDPTLAADYVAPLADGLEVPGRERFLGEVARVALADGPLTAGQQQVIDDVGRALGLTPAHVVGIVALADQRDAGTTPSEG